MSQPTDDDLGALLTEAFADHEHLADPDRAVRIAASPGRPPQRGRVLLAAAAAVALVAGGTTYALSRGGGASPAVSTGPSQTPQPPLPAQVSNAARRAAAKRAAAQTLGQVRAYPGSRSSGPIGPLRATYVSYGANGDAVTLTGWWTAGGATPRSVAGWYARHATTGFISDGGVSSASGSDSPTVYLVDFYARGSQQVLGAPGQHVLVETTALGPRVGIRVSVVVVWSPARARASFVQDVTSIDVTSKHIDYTHRTHTTTRSFTITDPAKVLAAAKAFDALEASPPIGQLNCPMMIDVYRDRVVFHTRTGDVVLTTGGGCVDVGNVERDGRPVVPPLADASSFLFSIGLSH